jgi:hypothetical protein
MKPFTASFAVILTALTALLVSSCESHRWKFNPDIVKVDFQDETILVLQRAIGEHYGIPRERFEAVDLNILWADEACPYKPSNVQAAVWTYREHGCLAGQMFGCHEIYVALNVRGVGWTALAHEVGHCYNQEVRGQYDRAHQDREYWDVVHGTAKFAREAGWDCPWCEIKPFSGEYP